MPHATLAPDAPSLVPVVDTHIDAPTQLLEEWRDLDAASPGREFDYASARTGGLAVAFMSIYASADWTRYRSSSPAASAISPLRTVAPTASKLALAERNAKAKAANQPLEDVDAFDVAWKTSHPMRPTTIDAVLEQIDYGVKLLGAEHVGIGSDFDGVDGDLPTGLRTVADYPNLVAGLRARGQSSEHIAQIMGRNLLRVWRQVEAAAC